MSVNVIPSTCGLVLLSEEHPATAIKLADISTVDKAKLVVRRKREIEMLFVVLYMVTAVSISSSS
jgi:hypothetical protein